VVFKDHLAAEDAVPDAWPTSTFVMALRERRRFHGLSSTPAEAQAPDHGGQRNASIDMKAAAERGVTGRGTAGLP